MQPAVLIYRIGHFFYKLKFPLLPKVLTYINRILFSVWLPSSCKIGKNFTLGYNGLGVVIHGDCEIGDNCHINQNVTIGRNFKDFKVPVIGDDVYIGAGSVVFGEISIGNNCMVGSNSLINKSVLPNTTMAGNPAKILERNRKLKYYQIDVKNN